MNTHEDWLHRVTNGASYRDIGLKTGIHFTSISRRLNRQGELTAEQVLLIAQAYGYSQVAALKETGYLTEVPPESPRDLAKRIQDDAQRLQEMLDKSNIIQLPRRDVSPHSYSGQSIPEDAVADSSKEVGGSLDDFDT